MSERPDILLALRGWSLTRETAAGPVTLLRDLDLTLRRGEWVALAGANGSGKTSLLRWLAGEDSPLRVRCGLVFQDPGEPLVGGDRRRGTGARTSRAGPPAPLLREFGLDGAAGLDPRVLSAGEQQRLGLAVAEAGEPELLLCDEPAALQDEAHARWLRERLRAWRVRTGGAVVYATQRRAEALLADRLVVLDGGRIVADGAAGRLWWIGRRRWICWRRRSRTAEAADVSPRGRTGAATVVAAWENVSCRWPEGARGFAGVSLRLRAGDRIGITGASGAGKSTLLACAAGLRAPDTGRCRLAGRALCARGSARSRTRSARCWRRSFPSTSSRGRAWRRKSRSIRRSPRAGVDGVLAAAGLPPALAGRNPHDLSSGERRRLAVALVGLSGRPLLLFDEPTAGLDRGGARGVAHLLRAAPADAAVVVASHDPAFLVACGCRIFSLGPDGLRPAPDRGARPVRESPRLPAILPPAILPPVRNPTFLLMRPREAQKGRDGRRKAQAWQVHAFFVARRRPQRRGGVMTFVEKAVIMDGSEMQRAITRIAHEIIEANKGTDQLVFLGIQRRGVPLARQVADAIAKVEGVKLPIGALDITFYRDDLSTLGPAPRVAHTEVPFDVSDKIVILVDDVLYTGRTVRAALDEIMDWGRPRAIRLAVLVDRGHRELPIRPDFVGKNVPTAGREVIKVKVLDFDGKQEVVVGEVQPQMILKRKDLLGLEELSAEEILGILDVAEQFRAIFDRPVRKVPIMRGRTVVNLFFEPSTRTRISFELAEKRLSADIVNFSASTSSLKKGETLRDTAREHRGDEDRHDHHAPRLPGGGGLPGARAQEFGHQRRRRRARTPDPGSARPHDDAPAPRRSGRDAGSRSSATSRTAAWRARTSGA